MTTLRTAAQQALEALYEETAWFGPTPKGAAAIAALKAALAQQAEPVQEQDVEDAIEAAYWHFDARKKGLNEWAYAPQSERDAFKAEARKLVRGYFPTRQAQDTKREMLAVADAFIRGKRAALAQQNEPQTLDEAMRLPRAMAQAYENGYKAGVAAEREACARACEHQPHWVSCVAAIRARGTT